jgi:hypothetical protein
MACISVVVEPTKFLHETIDDDAPVITWSVYVNIHDDVQVQ